MYSSRRRFDDLFLIHFFKLRIVFDSIPLHGGIIILIELTLVKLLLLDEALIKDVSDLLPIMDGLSSTTWQLG